MVGSRRSGGAGRGCGRKGGPPDKLLRVRICHAMRCDAMQYTSGTPAVRCRRAPAPRPCVRWGDTAAEASGTADGSVDSDSAIFFVSLIIVPAHARAHARASTCTRARTHTHTHKYTHTHQISVRPSNIAAARTRRWVTHAPPTTANDRRAAAPPRAQAGGWGWDWGAAAGLRLDSHPRGAPPPLPPSSRTPHPPAAPPSVPSLKLETTPPALPPCARTTRA